MNEELLSTVFYGALGLIVLLTKINLPSLPSVLHNNIR
jgi:hypothetical protein